MNIITGAMPWRWRRAGSFRAEGPETSCRAPARHFFTIHSSLFTWLPHRGSCRRSRLRGRAAQCRFLSGPAGPGANLLQTCNLRGLPGPGPRVTFWPARKSPKSRQRRRRSDSPPPLESLSPPAKAGGFGPRLGSNPRRASARHLFTIHFSLIDSTVLLNPGARPLSHGCAVPAPPQGEPRVGCAPGQRQRKEKQGAQVCTTSTALLRAPGQRASGWGR